jgi:hypothetical protein
MSEKDRMKAFAQSTLNKFFVLSEQDIKEKPTESFTEANLQKRK